jgi:hypothetical protein
MIRQIIRDELYLERISCESRLQRVSMLVFCFTALSIALLSVIFSISRCEYIFLQLVGVIGLAVILFILFQIVVRLYAL